jgi:hypothetical protein
MVWKPGLPLGIRYLNPNLPPTIEEGGVANLATQKEL